MLHERYEEKSYRGKGKVKFSKLSQNKDAMTQNSEKQKQKNNNMKLNAEF